MSECRTFEKCDCWNNCEDALKDRIRRSKFVKKARAELMKKRYKKALEN